MRFFFVFYSTKIVKRGAASLRIKKEWLKLPDAIRSEMTPSKLGLAKQMSTKGTQWMDAYTLYRMIMDYSKPSARPTSTCATFNQYILFYAGTAHTEHILHLLDTVSDTMQTEMCTKTFVELPRPPMPMFTHKLDVANVVAAWTSDCDE